MDPHASRKSLFDFRLSKKPKRASANSYRSGNVNGSRSNQGRGAGGARLLALCHSLPRGIRADWRSGFPG